MKKAFGNFNSKTFFIQCSIIVLIASRFLVLTPELWKLEKHKRKLALPQIPREITISERLKSISSDRDKPSIKREKINEQIFISNNTDIAFSLSDERIKAFTPYFGQYIEPPKLG